MATRVLFVGGPFDKRRVTFVKEAPAVYAVGVLPKDTQGRPVADADIEQTLYRLLSLAVGSTTLTLLVHETVEDVQVLVRLMSGAYKYDEGGHAR